VDAKTSPRRAMLEVKKKLGALTFEPQEEIRGPFVALLSGEHLLLPRASA
jgi:hypothetical protein